MKTLPIRLEDDLAAALEVVCREQGRTKADLVTDLVRKYLQTQAVKHALADPALVALYEDLAAEDVALAEQGLSDYQQMLEAADQP
jgi:predicted DNA-binding protein